ncbi:MAG: hypothetical protein M3Y60_02260 [Bacteroidota bacterium]|nr:hypothetical protein [Bacteroidota bacterium]
MVRTCLLISDDPDDHLELSEALYEISDDTVLVTVSDVNKALDLLTANKCIPEFILLNLIISGLVIQEFLNVLDANPALSRVRIIAYGESATVQSGRFAAILGADLTYSELKEALKKLITR